MFKNSASLKFSRYKAISPWKIKDIKSGFLWNARHRHRWNKHAINESFPAFKFCVLSNKQVLIVRILVLISQTWVFFESSHLTANYYDLSNFLQKSFCWFALKVAIAIEDGCNYDNRSLSLCNSSYHIRETCIKNTKVNISLLR